MAKRPLIIAHRGASAYEKENTLKAFQLAKKQGADCIELDIRQTLDNVLVVSHSRGIKKGRKRYWIDRYTLFNLEEIVGENKVLTLEKVFKEFGNKFGFFLDLKQIGMEKNIVSLIRKFGFGKKVFFDSNNGLILFNLKKIAPSFQTVLYYEPHDQRDLGEYRLTLAILFFIAFILSLPIRNLLPKYFLSKVLFFGADGVSFYYRFLNKKMVKLFQEEKIKIFVWGIQSERQMKRVLPFNINGIITKKPDVVHKILEENVKIKNQNAK